MQEAIVNALSGLGAGIFNLHWSNPIMIALGGLLLFLGIKKGSSLFHVGKLNSSLPAIR